MLLHILKDLKYKEWKFFYYLKNLYIYFSPTIFFQYQLKKILSTISNYDKLYIQNRVDYYNKLTSNGIKKTDIEKLPLLQSFKIPKKLRVYFFDAYKYTRFFSKELRINFLFGDITQIPTLPSIVKSRPISEYNQNAVLLKLDSPRHFIFIKDKIRFEHKKNQLIFRGGVYQEHRKRFLKKYFSHLLCNLGSVNYDANHPQWYTKKISIEDHLQYKFILSLEGNDVASNLKWVMSSNSIAVMPKPKFETWFMEGKLIPNFHYILIKDDYSDLQEKLEYYIQHTEEALKIIENAHQYIVPFKNRKQEDLISVMVLKKYFEETQ